MGTLIEISLSTLLEGRRDVVVSNICYSNLIEITPSTNPEKDIKPKMQAYGVQKNELQSNPEIYRKPMIVIICMIIMTIPMIVIICMIIMTNDRSLHHVHHHVLILVTLCELNDLFLTDQHRSQPTYSNYQTMGHSEVDQWRELGDGGTYHNVPSSLQISSQLSLLLPIGVSRSFCPVLSIF
jgi:hypothetical protein